MISINYEHGFFKLCIAEIQEFYEATLLDSDKTLQEKTAETLQVASNWEKNPPISKPKPPSVTDFSSTKPQLHSEAEVISFKVCLVLKCCIW